MKRSILVLSLLLLSTLIISCSEEDSQGEIPLNDPISNMTPEERQAKAPNTAFEVVYRNQEEVACELVADNPLLFLEHNEDAGRTPLMIAIKNNRKRIAQCIVKGLTMEDLYAKDQYGRGYLSYAAEAGMLQVIRDIGEMYDQSLSWGVSRFYNIDFKDDFGRTSLFYASDSAVAKVLKNYWMQWKVSNALSETWFSGFYNTIDKGGKNFFHTAAADNRYDVLRWGVKEVCGPYLLEESEGFWGGAGYVVTGTVGWGINMFQSFKWTPDDLVNRFDSFNDVDGNGEEDQGEESGNTPLHYAVRYGHWESSQVLLNCWLTQVERVNDQGRNTLGELLFHIDRNQETVSDSYKKIFDRILEKGSHYSAWVSWDFKANVINNRDEVCGESALHYAARLKDPYFYNNLSEIGDPHLESDCGGETPVGIFSGRSQAQ